MSLCHLAFLIILSLSFYAQAKEVALSFDDAPSKTSQHFNSIDRTNELVRKLNELQVPPTMIFANGCKGENLEAMRRQLTKYTDAGHLIQNHTCSHPRLDKVGFKVFSEDVEKGEQLLQPLLKGQKYFRFPFLNEGTDESVRDQMRLWLKSRGYRNASISGDNEDPTFSAKINEAKKLGKKIDYQAIKQVFLDHVISSLECNDELAVKNLGRSPKHMLLLHEADATVMFIDSLVSELRSRGWRIISAEDAYTDELYNEEPKNTYSGFGIIAQVVFEKTGKKKSCYDYSALTERLNVILDLKK